MLRDIPSNTLYTVLMAISLLALALAKLMAPARFNEFINVIGNSRYLKIYSRDQKFIDLYDGLLFVNLVLSLTIFCNIYFSTVVGDFKMDYTLTVKLLLGSSIFILAKVLIERLIGSLFEIDAIIDNYLFQKISYKNYLGLLLLPVNGFLVFSITPTKPIIYTVIIALSIVNLSGLLTSFKTHLNEIKHNLFYFILYLCALEISPYIIVYAIFVPT